MIINIFGLPGSGKSSLSKELLSKIEGIHLNADEIRSDLNKDLGFSEKDRIENARRISAVAKILSNQKKLVICDFINPTNKTREAFGKSDISIWLNTIEKSIYEDTNILWEAPSEKYFHLKINKGLSIKEECELIIKMFHL